MGSQGVQASQQPRIPKAGVWVTAVTVFDQATDTLDLESQKKYYADLSQTGLAGLVTVDINSAAGTENALEKRKARTPYEGSG